MGLELTIYKYIESNISHSYLTSSLPSFSYRNSGGYGVVKKALSAYGYEPGEKLKAFKTDVITHNDLTFSMYTDKVRKELQKGMMVKLYYNV